MSVHFSPLKECYQNIIIIMSYYYGYNIRVYDRNLKEHTV